MSTNQQYNPYNKGNNGGNKRSNNGYNKNYQMNAPQYAYANNGAYYSIAPVCFAYLKCIYHGVMYSPYMGYQLPMNAATPAVTSTLNTNVSEYVPMTKFTAVPATIPAQTMSHPMNANYATFTPATTTTTTPMNTVNNNNNTDMNRDDDSGESTDPLSVDEDINNDISIPTPLPTVNNNTTTTPAANNNASMMNVPTNTIQAPIYTPRSFSSQAVKAPSFVPGAIKPTTNTAVKFTPAAASKAEYINIFKKLVNNDDGSKAKEEEEKKKQEEEERKRKEEEERIAAEKARKEEEERRRKEEEERIRKEEEERIAAEKAKKEEEERIAAEKAKKEEEERMAAEKAKKEEEERKRKEESPMPTTPTNGYNRQSDSRNNYNNKYNNRDNGYNNNNNQRPYHDNNRGDMSRKNSRKGPNDKYNDNNNFNNNGGGRGGKRNNRGGRSGNRNNFNAENTNWIATPIDEEKYGFFKTEDKLCYLNEEIMNIWSEEKNELEEMNIMGVNTFEYTIVKTDRAKPITSATSSHLDIIKKQMQSILNKLTLDKFDALSKEILNIHLNTITEFEAIATLIYNKAVIEPKFSSMYAQLCQLLKTQTATMIANSIITEEIEGKFYWKTKNTIPVPEKDDKVEESEPMGEGMNTKEEAMEEAAKKYSIKKLLTKKCQEEFEAEDRYDDINKKIEECQQEMKSTRDKIVIRRNESALNEYEYEKNSIRRRTFGNVEFIGQLFNHNVLRVYKVLLICIEDLTTQYDNPDDEKTECLCKLLTTIGEVCSKDSKFKQLVEDTLHNLEPFSKNDKLSSRVRFAIKDVLELKDRNWVSRKNDSKLVSLTELRKQQILENLQKASAAAASKAEQPKLNKGKSQKAKSHNLGRNNSNISLRPGGKSSSYGAMETPTSPVTPIEEPAIPAGAIIEPISEEHKEKYFKTIKSSFDEYKESHEVDDFQYYVNDKREQLKDNDYSNFMASVFLYIGENFKLDDNFKVFCDILNIMCEQYNLTSTNIIDGLHIALYTIGDIDAPLKYQLSASLLNSFIEKNHLKKEDIDTLGNSIDKSSDSYYNYQDIMKKM
ncbi:hypothetical protein WA158_007853 [Blastocystis sp. Blastoise]